MIQYTQIKHGLLHGLLTPDRFRLDEDFTCRTRLRGFSAFTEYINLDSDGLLEVVAPWEWDGASGPTWDTRTTLEGSAVHDALYQLIKAGLLPRSVRWQADAELWYRMRKDGAWWWRAAYYYAAVQTFGWTHL